MNLNYFSSETFRLGKNGNENPELLFKSIQSGSIKLNKRKVLIIGMEMLFLFAAPRC